MAWSPGCDRSGNSRAAELSGRCIPATSDGPDRRGCASKWPSATSTSSPQFRLHRMHAVSCRHRTLLFRRGTGADGPARNANEIISIIPCAAMKLSGVTIGCVSLLRSRQPCRQRCEDRVHRLKMRARFIQRHDQGWADAKHLAGQRAEQVDRQGRPHHRGSTLRRRPGDLIRRVMRRPPRTPRPTRPPRRECSATHGNSAKRDRPCSMTVDGSRAHGR